MGVAAPALLLGGLVLWLALPRVVASSLLALRDPVIQQMVAGERVSNAQLLGVMASRELALRWVEDRDTHNERGTASTSLAFREEPQSATRRTMLERAVGALRAGLAVAPGDPRDWMQLGYLLVLLQGDTNRAAAEALLISMRVGAFEEPQFLNRRLFWSLAHWAFYGGEERDQIGEQARLVWRVAPGELANLALAVPELFAPIASSLEKVPGAHEQFVAALAFATPSSGGTTPPKPGR